MTRKILFGTMLAASLIGCAVVETGDHAWFKEGATPHEQEAALGAATVRATQAQVTPAEKRDMVIRSMTAQGWRLVQKDSAPPLKPAATRKTSTPITSGTTLQ